MPLQKGDFIQPGLSRQKIRELFFKGCKTMQKRLCQRGLIQTDREVYQNGKERQ